MKSFISKMDNNNIISVITMENAIDDDDEEFQCRYKRGYSECLCLTAFAAFIILMFYLRSINR